MIIEFSHQNDKLNPETFTPQKEYKMVLDVEKIQDFLALNGKERLIEELSKEFKEIIRTKISP